ncbi:uncharacterized protein LOC122082825 [Macadamia integrifolia]|uniref:uncharacterized protein LOC122082825 n=1 Tax=Macadamia integrifolia TaxID=60698 RepID=UPI001C4EB30B|nr:uncharacterized protein LOC122082825 [Macadamia integrifolia]
MGGVAEDQEKSMPPPAWRRMKSYEQDEVQSKSAGKLRRRRCIQCCGCLSALMLIIIIVGVILIFTVFRVKDATVTLNSISFDKLKVSRLPTIDPSNPFAQPTTPSVNMTMMADMSIKNPNIASFKFNNATTSIFYDGSQVGEARNPAGNARARRTLHMNLTVELFITANSSSSEKVQHLLSDIRSGSLSINSYTWIDGRVNVLNIFKRYIIVKMNCTVDVSLSSMSMQDMKCEEHVEL